MFLQYCRNIPIEQFLWNEGNNYRTKIQYCRIIPAVILPTGSIHYTCIWNLKVHSENKKIEGSIIITGQFQLVENLWQFPILTFWLILMTSSYYDVMSRFFESIRNLARVDGLFINLARASCSSNPCLNGGTCNEENFSYSCSCRSGYKSNNCQGMWILLITNSRSTILYLLFSVNFKILK